VTLAPAMGFNKLSMYGSDQPAEALPDIGVDFSAGDTTKTAALTRMLFQEVS